MNSAPATWCTDLEAPQGNLAAQEVGDANMPGTTRDAVSHSKIERCRSPSCQQVPGIVVVDTAIGVEYIGPQDRRGRRLMRTKFDLELRRLAKLEFAGAVDRRCWQRCRRCRQQSWLYWIQGQFDLLPEAKRAVQTQIIEVGRLCQRNEEWALLLLDCVSG